MATGDFDVSQMQKKIREAAEEYSKAYSESFNGADFENNFKKEQETAKKFLDYYEQYSSKVGSEVASKFKTSLNSAFNGKGQIEDLFSDAVVSADGLTKKFSIFDTSAIEQQKKIVAQLKSQLNADISGMKQLGIDTSS